MNQAYFKKYNIEQTEADALKHIAKIAGKIARMAKKEEDYLSKLMQLEAMILDFKEAKE